MLRRKTGRSEKPRLHSGSDSPTVAYATVYPLTTLLRILSAQVLAIVLVG